MYALDPLRDARWSEFIDARPGASIFHTPQWLEAIRKTYGYDPVVYTTTAQEKPLANGLVVCRVRSWLTGKRLVSVPFADHCEPLVTEPIERDELVAGLQETVRRGPWKYFEIRPRNSEGLAPPSGFHECNSYVFHAIDLRPSTDELFAALHKHSIQRKIRRGDREGLTYSEGRSEALLADFYRLLLLTRRRHQLPPQPIQWFRNLIATMGDRLTISTVSKDRKAVGAIMLLRHGDTLVYKYGASDAGAHNLGTMPLMFWKVMCVAKNAGVRELDLGRSDAGDEGLITFKDRLGARRTVGRYFRYSRRKTNGVSTPSSTLAERAKPLFARLPDNLLVATGRMFYRHMG